MWKDKCKREVDREVAYVSSAGNTLVMWIMFGVVLLVTRVMVCVYVVYVLVLEYWY